MLCCFQVININLVVKFEVNHNKKYSVVKTFRLPRLTMRGIRRKTPISRP